jgi:hypothetical protein
MSARITIDLLPSGKPGHVHVALESRVSDGSALTAEEIVTTLEVTIAGLRDGTIRQQGSSEGEH